MNKSGIKDVSNKSRILIRRRVKLTFSLERYKERGKNYTVLS